MKQKSEATGLDYANGNITYIFKQLFLPTLLGMIFNALITIIDGIFVGQGVGPDGIAAVNIIAPLYMITTGIGLMFGIGASVVAGIALSQSGNRKACVNMTQSFILAGTIISVFSLLLLLFPEQTARMFGCSDRLLPKALDYLLLHVPAIFFLLFEMIGMMLIRLDGSPKYAMMCNIIPAVFNIVLDWYLVFPMNMGVKGAAIATSASVILGAMMVIIYLIRYSYVMKFCLDMKNFAANTIRQAAIGSSAFITEIAMSIMMITGNYVFMKYHGEAGVAAYSIACYLFPLIFMMSNAVAQSAQPIISYNYGAGSIERVREAFRISMRVALLCGAISTVSIGLMSGGIVSLFIDPDCEAGRIASEGLPIYAICAIFFSANIACIGYYQSIEKATRAAVFTLLRGVIYLIPLFLIMPVIIPGRGAWTAIPLSEILTLITIIIFSVGKRHGK